MRISTAAAYAQNVSSLQERQRSLHETQQHLNAQKRVLRAGDDPAAAARAERAQTQIARAEVQQRALEASRSNMTAVESTLGSATGLLHDARSALIQAGNGVLSDAERAGIAKQLQSIREQLVTLAGQRDAAGNPLFGTAGAANGSEQVTAGAEALPLTVDGAAAWYQASDGNGQFKVTNSSGSATAWSDAGRVTDLATFSTQTSPPAVADPNALTYEVRFNGGGVNPSYTVYKDGAAMPAASVAITSQGADTTLGFDGMSFGIRGTPDMADKFTVKLAQPQLSVFATLDQAITALGTSGRTGAQVTQTVQDAIAGLDGSLTALGSLRSRVGEALNHADAAEERNAVGKEQAQQNLSEAQDLDLAQAISNFQLQQTSYEAALKTYSMVQKLSLFQYIGG